MEKSGVYILQSQKNGKYYIGSTNDIKRRLEEHNKGYVLSTKKLCPWILKVFIECKDSAEAKSSEYRLKQYKRRDITEKAIKDLTFPWNYISPM